LLQVFRELLPVHALFLAAPVYPFVNQLTGLLVELLQARKIPTDSVILIVASELGNQHFPPFLDFCRISYRFQPVIHLLKLHIEILPSGLSSYLEVAFPRFITEVREPQEVKRVWLLAFSLCICPGISPKFNKSGLFFGEV